MAMRHPLGVVLCVFTAMSVAYGNLMDRLGWDDQYARALSAIEMRDGKEVAADKIRMIGLAGVTWPENHAREAISAKVSELRGEPRSSIRLEYGNANLSSYGVVWALATPQGIFLFAHRGKSVERRIIDEEKYAKLWGRLEGLKAWDLQSDADLYLSDGSVYFLSLYSEGRSHQAAIYGPPRYGRTAAERNLVPSADQFAQVIKEMLALAD